MEVVGYGSYEARLACSRRAMEEVTPLPSTAEAAVAVLAVAEVVEVVKDPAAELGVEGEAVKRGRVSEGNRLPGTPCRD